MSINLHTRVVSDFQTTITILEYFYFDYLFQLYQWVLYFYVIFLLLINILSFWLNVFPLAFHLRWLYLFWTPWVFFFTGRGGGLGVIFFSFNSEDEFCQVKHCCGFSSGISSVLFHFLFAYKVSVEISAYSLMYDIFFCWFKDFLFVFDFWWFF